MNEWDKCFSVYNITRKYIIGISRFQRKFRKNVIIKKQIPALRSITWSVIGSEVKCGICLAHSTSWTSCLSVAGPIPFGF